MADIIAVPQEDAQAQLMRLALERIASSSTRRAYSAAMDEFLTWARYQSPAGFSKVLVQQYKSMLLEKKGSEQESVRPPGFIGFPGFWADGPTRFHGPGSESSPMFTDLSARSCIYRRCRWISPVSVYADDRRGPTHRGEQARAATQRANPIGWCEGLARGRSGKGQTAPNIP